jgi:3-hydroxymyristoyl/3-hydroxydecanoyl-(acyl carrier protein) dehydratase
MDFKPTSFLDMLLQSVKYVQIVDNTLQATICFSHDLSIFPGHFPGKPIVPAVYLCGICRTLLEHNQNCTVLGILKSRFLGICAPDTMYSVLGILSKKDDSMKAQYTIQKAEQVLTTISFSCQLKT